MKKLIIVVLIVFGVFLGGYLVGTATDSHNYDREWQEIMLKKGVQIQ